MFGQVKSFNFLCLHKVPDSCYNEIMHELGIANQVFELLVKEGESRNATVKGVDLIIGRMSGIMPDSLVFLLQTISQGSICDNLTINFELVDPELVCADCKNKFSAEEYDFTCPKCGGGDCKIIAGDVLIVEKIHLEVNDGT